ncbi:MAG TPA: methionine ABC transporter permease [Virgibacillus sp.]|nr:methionine ABC transporter permease [Virgibacillus sp.]
MSFDFSNIKWDDFWVATYETFYMTIIGLAGTLVFGLFLGLLLFLTAKDGMWHNKFVYFITTSFVNIFRAVPFIILIFLLTPISKMILGTIRGPNAALLSLIVGAGPFYGRLVEIALREVDKGVIEASKSMGAKLRTIIFRVLIPESLPALVSGLTVTAIALIGYTAIAGVIGAGGLGNYAYYFGFQRRSQDIVIACSVALVLIVFLFQFIGDKITSHLDKR